MKNGRAKFKEEFQRRVYRFALDVITFIDGLPKERTASIIADQLLRSATSIGANVVEAQASSSKKDYTSFFTYALKSANETKFWLALLRDSGKCDQDKANHLLNRLSKKGSPKGRSPFGINSSPSPWQGEGEEGGEVFRQPLKEASEIASILGASILTLKGKG